MPVYIHMKTSFVLLILTNCLEIKIDLVMHIVSAFSVSPQVPLNWENFLKVAENKTELFAFLNKALLSIHIDGKQLFFTQEP